MLYRTRTALAALLSRIIRKTTFPAYSPFQIESFEPRLLMSSTPVGNVDILDRAHVVGWAYSAEDGAASVQVEVDINGVRAAILSAHDQRDDLLSGLGSRYHGFSYSFGALITPGNNTLQLYAIDSANTRTLIHASTLTNPAPIGTIDFLSSQGLAGWVYDADSGSAVPTIYRLDVNGVQGQLTEAADPRPDLAPFLGSANHGFYIPGNFTGKVVDLYALDNPTGQMVLVRSTAHAPTGNVDVLNTTTVAGWAFDQDLAGSPVSIRVDVDGVAGTPFLANLERPDLAPLLGSTAHGFQTTLAALAPGQHDIKVYALHTASTSAAPKLLLQKTVTNPSPIGNLDIVNANLIAGWAFDPDAGANPIQVTVYVDDTAFATVNANLSRPDLASLGSTNHGFAVDLSSISRTSHSITVTLHDSVHSDKEEIVLYDDFINNHEPVGNLDIANGSILAGWAFDPDAGSDPIPVDVYVDNTFIGTSSANTSRPDLAPLLGSSNHGFLVNLPTLSFGAHTVDIYAAESQGTVSTKIGSATITNNRPLGNIDVFSAHQIIGWAVDPDVGPATVAVQLVIDGVLAKTQDATDYRADLAAYFGHGNHGFTFTLDDLHLTPGPHEIDIFTLDPNNAIASPVASHTLFL